MRDYLDAIENLLTEEHIPVQESKVKTTDESRQVYRIRNWSEMKTVCDRASYGQIRGVFDFEHNEAWVCDASVMSHSDIITHAGVCGLHFYVQHRFGTMPQIALEDNYTVSVQGYENPEDYAPAFAPMVGLTPDQFSDRFWEAEDEV